MMNRSSALAVALTLAVAFAAPVAAGSLALPGSASESGTVQADSSLTALQQNNSSDNGSISPGAKLAGVVSVQGAEVSGEVEHRAFGQRMAAANSNASKAAVIAEQSQDLETRLETIRAEQQALQAKYENGTISTGQYKARMAKLAAEARTIQRLLDTTSAVASKIPAATLAEKGVSLNSITKLRTNARNLTGPEVSKIAIEIGGKQSGKNPPGLGNTSNGGFGLGNGNETAIPGNGSGVGSGNGTPGSGSNGNGTNGAPGVGNGSPGVGNGTPGNGTPGLGNGTPGLGNGTPGNGSTVNITVDGSTTTTLSTTDAASGTLV